MGPAVESPEKVKELIQAGMNMARLNLSHGGYEEHQTRLDRVRDAAKAAGKPIAILVSQLQFWLICKVQRFVLHYLQTVHMN